MLIYWKWKYTRIPHSHREYIRFDWLILCLWFQMFISIKKNEPLKSREISIVSIDTQTHTFTCRYTEGKHSIHLAVCHCYITFYCFDFIVYWYCFIYFTRAQLLFEFRFIYLFIHSSNVPHRHRPKSAIFVFYDLSLCAQVYKYGDVEIDKQTDRQAVSQIDIFRSLSLSQPVNLSDSQFK